MKYSVASYLKFAMPFPGASDGVDSYIAPAPVIAAEMVGSETAVGVCGRLAAGAAPCPRPCPMTSGRPVKLSTRTIAIKTRRLESMKFSLGTVAQDNSTVRSLYLLFAADSPNVDNHGVK